jgi:lycopene beta-cyclase
MPSPDYDYIITGAGAAGLSLLAHWMSYSGIPGKYRILLVDRAPKTQNDRTWCFWEKGEGVFESIVYRQWDRLWFHGEGYSDLKDILPYRYKMIRGIDFYKYCFDLIRLQRNIDLLYGQVEQLHSGEADGGESFVVVGGKKITAGYIFNSILHPGATKYPSHTGVSPRRGYWRLLQHFKGWVIRTPKPLFHPEEATLMDFRVSQEQGAAFVYVMPFSTTEALIEYTLFSEKALEQGQYEAGLRNYIHQVLHVERYTILEEEYGIIPMTNEPFPSRENNILHIGTAGGQTKPSTGYTFPFIQRQSRAIVQSLKETGHPFGAGTGLSSACSASPGRFRYYDGVLLNVLANGRPDGKKIFTELFSRNKTVDIFRFLDNESRWPQEMRIIGSLPFGPFLRAGWQQFFR